MLQHPLRHGPDAELRWLFAESDALQHFRTEAPSDACEPTIIETRRWVMRDLRRNGAHDDPGLRDLTADLFARFHESQIEQWSLATWETITLHLLWHICREGVHDVPAEPDASPPPVRLRDLLLDATGIDTDALVNEELIRYCAAFLDQGIAHWSLPNRQQGFFQSWSELYRESQPVELWRRGLPEELDRIRRFGWSPLEVIADAFQRLGVDDSQREEYLSQTLLALRGWAGMIWQMETNAEWTVHPAPKGTLVEYTAVRLVLECLALRYVAQGTLGYTGELCDLWTRLRKGVDRRPRVSVEQRAFFVFQLAQVLGGGPPALSHQSKDEWSELVREIEMFSARERRRIYHLAFERRFRIQVLDGVIARTRRPLRVSSIKFPNFRSSAASTSAKSRSGDTWKRFRRECETFGAAGFFGVAMYYRGVADAHYVPALSGRHQAATLRSGRSRLLV